MVWVPYGKLVSVGGVACLVLVVWGCGRKDEPLKGEAPTTVFSLIPAAYTDTTLEFPPLTFTNGVSSLNDRCPVRKAKLNQRLAPLFVNGRPIGFC